MSIEIRQCPRCELRFASKWELELHLADSHPEKDDETGNDRESGRDDESG